MANEMTQNYSAYEGATSNSLVVAPNHKISLPWKDAGWQKLWLSTQQREWKTLALIAGSNHGPKDFVKRVANALSRTGMIHRGAPVRVTDATGLALHDLLTFVDQLQRCVAYGDRVLIALDPISENPSSVSIAQAADAVAMCVVLGETCSASARRTMTEIGKARFLGSIVVDDAPLAGADAY